MQPNSLMDRARAFLKSNVVISSEIHADPPSGFRNDFYSPPMQLLSYIGVLVVYAYPGFVAEWPEYLPSFAFGSFFLFGLFCCIVFSIWAYLTFVVCLAAAHLYFEEFGSIHVHAFGWTVLYSSRTKSEVFSLAAWAYLSSIYGFALIYRFADLFNNAFGGKINGIVAGLYFSVSTIATVGYGDIVPVTSGGRLMVSGEILLGTAYTVFFFSIIASFMRERRQS